LGFSFAIRALFRWPKAPGGELELNLGQPQPGDAQIALGLVDLHVRDPNEIAATLERFSDFYRGGGFF
jgi:hypothetical protein